MLLRTMPISIPGSEIAPRTPPLRGKSTNESYKNAFQLVDRNGDGVLSPEELCVFMRNISTMEVEDVLREVDHNNDGVVSFEEFANLMELQNHGAEQSIREIWRGLDCNRDGDVSAQEIRLAMQALGAVITPEPNPTRLLTHRPRLLLSGLRRFR